MVAVALPAWMREYRDDWLRPDLIAGLTLAACLLPAGLADASLAGLPPEAGLYACLFSGLVFGFFCSSRHTVVTVTTALSQLIGTMSGGNPARHVALAAALVLMVAAIAVAEPNGWVRDALRRVNYGPFEDQTVSAAVLSGRAPRTV